jgi:UDP-glucose 4-epimerase
MMRILVTGATGFVGSALCRILCERGYGVRAAIRSERSLPNPAAERAVIGEIGAATDWAAALQGIDAVIHTAARVHRVDDSRAESEAYIETNARGTQHLAEAAVRAGVRRLIYLSSVKVNGEETHGRAFSAADVPQPQDPYAAAKWRGEQYLQQISAATALQAVIVRSPLVYGPRVRANFLRMLRWVDRGWPLPLGAVDNQRSLVSLWNLCDLIVRLLDHPGAAGRTWMVSDGRDLSTRQLIRSIAEAMRRRLRLVPVPAGLLYLGGALLGRRGEVSRLCGSLTVDIGPTRSELGWVPPLSVEEAIARTVHWYLAEGRDGGA